MNSDETQTPEPLKETQDIPAQASLPEDNAEEPPNLETDAVEENPDETPAVEMAEETGDRDRAEVQLSEPTEPVEPATEPTLNAIAPTPEELSRLQQRIAELQRQEQALHQEIAQLQAARAQILQEQLTETQAAMGRMVKDALSELEQRKHNLQITVEQLERRQERIQTEMRTTFAGVSQDLAIRVQGFKDYLSGSLQDLVSSVEQLDLTPKQPEPEKQVVRQGKPAERTGTPKFAEQGFQEQAKQIRRLLDKYRTMPDYYGPSWQLRRTFEPIHAERLSQWFFTQGGRGALRSMGSRLQNILVASAAISVLKSMYGDRVRTLVLASTPERLGEWRRGLQDCLGISRSDFGPDRGVVLFEAPEPLAQKADRSMKQKLLPLIVIDETENQINLSMLQFPLWLAFAPDPDLPTVL